MEKPKFNNRHNTCLNVDGKEYWISRSVATAGVIITRFKKEWYILLCKRGKGAADYQGFIVNPCGYLDMDESGTECFYREVYEETGFYVPSIKNKKIFFDYTKQPFFVHSDPSANKQNVTLYYGFVFKSKKYLPELSLENTEPDEVEFAKWIKLDNMKKIGDFAYNHDERITDFLKIVNLKIQNMGLIERLFYFIKKNY